MDRCSVRAFVLFCFHDATLSNLRRVQLSPNFVGPLAPDTAGTQFKLEDSGLPQTLAA